MSGLARCGLQVEPAGFDGGGRHRGLLHGEQVAAVEHGDAAVGDAQRHVHADLLHLLGRQATDEGRRAAQRVAAQQSAEVVRQGVVDGGFFLAREVQGDALLGVLGQGGPDGLCF